MESRLLLRILSRRLSECLGMYVDIARLNFWRKWKLHKKLKELVVQIASLIQSVSKAVLTPEITRSSFIRDKLNSFMEGVRFEEQMASIQSDFRNLNTWLHDDISITAAVWARSIAVSALLVSAAILITRCESSPIEYLQTAGQNIWALLHDLW